MVAVPLRLDGPEAPARREGYDLAVRRLLRWIVVTAGTIALVRWLRRRGETTVEAHDDTLEDPAEELRRKLEESRSPEPEAAPAPAPAQDSSVEGRRADVHAQGRAALAEMTSSDEG